MKTKLGQEPAFPQATDILANQTKFQHGNESIYGMSKRFYAACVAMQGLLANPDLNRFGTHDSDSFDVVTQSYKFADELLKQENE